LRGWKGVKRVVGRAGTDASGVLGDSRHAPAPSIVFEVVVGEREAEGDEEEGKLRE
jgi:hypothetical protein